MNVGMVVLAALGLVALFFISLSTIACRHISRGDYTKALKLLQLFPSDQTNLIRPVDMAYMEVLTGTYDSALARIQADMKVGTYPLHYMLLVLTHASRDDWRAAQDALIVANSIARTGGSDDIHQEDEDELVSLQTALEERDLEQVANSPVFIEMKEQLAVTSRRFYRMTILVGIIILLTAPLPFLF